MTVTAAATARPVLDVGPFLADAASPDAVALRLPPDMLDPARLRGLADPTAELQAVETVTLRPSRVLTNSSSNMSHEGSQNSRRPNRA